MTDTEVSETEIMDSAGGLGLELRMLEAMLFAATEPVSESVLASRMPKDADLSALLEELSGHYTGRGIRLSRVAGKWAFRTAEDLASHLRVETKVMRKLSRAAVETLAIIAYHQPVTRGEVEEIRGVALSRGTLDLFLELEWLRPVGKRRTPGRPTTWGTTQKFLEHFNLDSLSDLPGLADLKAAGLLDTRPVRTIFGEMHGKDDYGSGAEADQADDAENDLVPDPLDAEGEAGESAAVDDGGNENESESEDEDGGVKAAGLGGGDTLPLSARSGS